MSETAAECRAMEPVSGRPIVHAPDKVRDSDALVFPKQWHKTIEIDCGREAEFSIRSRSVADAVVANIASPPVTVSQNGAAGDAVHRFHVVLLLKGHGEYDWTHGTATQRPGDIMLLDTAEACQMVSSVSSRLVRWSFPETHLAPFLPLGDSFPMLHLPACEGLVKVVAQHTRQLAREASRLEPTVQRSLLVHLCGLLGLAVEAQTARRPAQRCNYRTFQRQRVLTYIEAHLSDPHCTAKRAAHDLGISVRWLHALLENMEDSFTDLVARRRLDDSLERLRNSDSDHLSIAEIAFHSGFNELSTFYRRFGERYGMTPGEARRAKRQPCNVS